MINIYTQEEVDQKLAEQRDELLKLLLAAQKAINRLEEKINGEILTVMQVAEQLHIKDTETIYRYMKLPMHDPKFIPSIALNGKSKGVRIGDLEKWIVRNRSKMLP